MGKIKTYSEMILLDSFEDRLRYLQLDGKLFDDTFRGNRPISQILYHLPEWRRIRDRIIARDNGFDLGHENYPILGRIYVHHINPISLNDIIGKSPIVYDLENLISCSFDTHKCIHYSIPIPKRDIYERTINDTCPWKN